MGALSADKANHLAHQVLTYLKGAKTVRLKTDDVVVLRSIKKVLAAELEQEAAIDQAVRKRLSSYSRPILEGTQEWDVMYRKAAEEEIRKQIRRP
ncbi:MAG: DUF507 family protein [Nitrospiraceae bacterium]